MAMLWMRLGVALSMLATWGGSLELAYEGADDAQHPRVAVMALVAVESCGKTQVRKGQFIGPLQMGRAYLEDAGASSDDVMSAYGSLLVWRRVQVKYRVRRPGEPLLVMAIFHKGGPGVLKTWRRIVARRAAQVHDDAGMRRMYREAAVAAAALHGIPGMGAFLDRFEAARSGSAAWCGKNNQWMR